MTSNLASFTDILSETDEIDDSQPISLSLPFEPVKEPASTSAQTKSTNIADTQLSKPERPKKHTGQHGDFRSIEEIDPKYRGVFSYPYFNLVQSSVIEDALYTDKSMVVCAPTGSGKTVVFEMAIVQLLMALEDTHYADDFKIIYMAPVKALCTERLTEWYPKFTNLGLLCIEVTGDTDVDFSLLKPYRIIITTPEKWDMLTRRWRDHRALVSTVKLFLIDEVHILNEETRGPVLEAVVSRMKTIEASSQSAHRIERLQREYQTDPPHTSGGLPSECPNIRFVAVSATISNPDDVAAWLGTKERPAVYYKFGDECRPVKLKRIVEGYPCPEGTSIFKFDIILNYRLWPIINKYHDGKPTLIFCNTRKSVALTAETLSKEITVSFSQEQRAKLAALASAIKNKKLQSLVLSGVGCHHAGLLFEERALMERAFRDRDLPILITTTTLAMGVNLPAHLVIIKNTQQYVNGQYQEYSISTVLQMVGRAGRPQFDTEATAVIMTRLGDKPRYQALVGGDEPLQSYLHKRLAENLNSEAALGTVNDVAQCVQWLRSTFLCVRAAKDPKRYLGLPQAAPAHLITKKLEELCVKAMNGLASAGLISMDDASCVEATEAGRLMSIYYLDLETMKHIMKINGSETLEQLLRTVCESHELADMHLRMDERRCLNALNRNNAAATVRYPMKGKITSRQMKLNCIIQAVLGCLPIPDPSLNQEAMKIMRIAERVCKCLVAYVTRANILASQPQYFSAVLNSLTLAKCISAHLWDNSPYVSRQLRGIGPTFSTLLVAAGKVNFMLLEESHPRDLERIMNKGPPAGNVIRKQVALLPKYQLTTTPLDETHLRIQLSLLNQAHLSENMANLTAGEGHRCHIVVGDSLNHLLLLTTFKDKDLIGVYDGTITYDVKRIHNFEHKVSVHCVSSSFVGVDVQCEHTFPDLAPHITRGEACFTSPPPQSQTKKTTTKKQTSITDTFKERKRKNSEIDITQSKEKKKRDTALMDKFKNLKESFSVTSQQVKADLQKTSEMSEQILNDTLAPDAPSRFCVDEDKFSSGAKFGWAVQESSALDCTSNQAEVSFVTSENENWKNDFQNFDNLNYSGVTEYPEMILEENDDDKFIVDDHIDDTLNEIESEISERRHVTRDFTDFAKPSETFKLTTFNREQRDEQAKKQPEVRTKFTKQESYKPSIETRKRKPNTKSNYSFIDEINKKMNSDTNDTMIPEKENGFSDAIKKEIEKFLTNAKSYTKPTTDIVIQELVTNNETGGNTNYPPIEENRNLTMPITESPQLPEFDGMRSEVPKPREVNISELPEVYIDDHRIKPKSIVETCKWLETQNLETMATAKDFDGPLEDDTDFEELVTNNDNNNTLDGYELNKSSHEDKKDVVGSIQHLAVKNDCGIESVDDYINKTVTSFEEINEEPKGCSPERIEELENMGVDRIKDRFEKENNNPWIVTEMLVPLKCHKRNAVDQSISKINYLNVNEINDEHKSLVLRNNKIIGEPNYYQTLEEEKYAIDTVQPVDTSMDKDDLVEWKPFDIKTLKESQHKICPNTEFKQTSRGIGYTPNQVISIAAHKAYINSLALNGKISTSKCRNEENSHKYGSEDPYVNKYSFSATQIDVSTKNTAKHQIQVIRKLKVDLDVTEIICKGKTVKNNEGGGQRNETLNLKTVSGNSRNFNGHQLLNSNQTQSSYFSNEVSIPAIQESEPEFYNSKRNVEPNNDVPKLDVKGETWNSHKPYMLTAPFHTRVNRTNLTDIKDSCVNGNTTIYNKKHDDSVDKNYHKEMKETQTHEDQSKHEDEIESKNTDVNKIHKEMIEEDKTDQENAAANNCSIVDTFQPNTKVGSILDKYSKILRKNNILDLNKDIDNNNSHASLSKGPVKTRKPFRISDIRNADIPLPKTLAVEISRSQKMPSKEDVLTRVKAIEKKELPIAKIQSDIKPVSEATHTAMNVSSRLAEHITRDRNDPQYYTAAPKLSEISDDIQSDILEMHISDTSMPHLGETGNDYNPDDVHEDMFNPRSLLKRFTENNLDDDKIIPPPMEFCDDTYSPTLCDNQDTANVDRFDIQSDCEESYAGADEYETPHTENPSHDRSIFHEYSRNILTPSKEIETWNITREDFEDTIARYPLKSCTVMRNKPETPGNQSARLGPALNSSKAKLGQFKLPKQDKLRL